MGCELLAFEKDKDELSKQLHFPAMVDMVVWRRSILLIGLSTAELILIDPNTYKLMFNWYDLVMLKLVKILFLNVNAINYSGFLYF